MRGLRQHLELGLRLHFRNRIALIYGYLFPLIFLVAFAVLYRHERFPLIRHLGELLTVSVLGGACFGLPTSLVSERERGVWRRYRLIPAATWTVVVSTAVARYFIILSAGVLQLASALAIGMPAPAHFFGLFVAFSVVTFAFIGLGLVIAMMADNVPAVQALGQCIFLPMLIIGGVAVQLTSLPVWAQHVAAFFPGRYAVQALQASANGGGLSAAGFSLLSLILIGVAGCLAGAKLFRWESGPQRKDRVNKSWIAVALGAWLTVGLLAEVRGRVTVAADSAVVENRKVSPPDLAGERERAIITAKTGAAFSQPTVMPTPTAKLTATALEPTSVLTPTVLTPSPPIDHRTSELSHAAVAAPVKVPTTWEAITPQQTSGLDYNVPPDDGIVSPMAPLDEAPEDEAAKQINAVTTNLVDWAPDRIKDPVQRVQNCLCIAAVPDVVQLPVERFLPMVVLEHLEDNVAKADLIKILTWIALHPEQGTVITDTTDLGVEAAVGDPDQVRERVHFYAVKFLIRLGGRKP